MRFLFRACLLPPTPTTMQKVGADWGGQALVVRIFSSRLPAPSDTHHHAERCGRSGGGQALVVCSSWGVLAPRTPHRALGDK
jgi:hypothetical protein